MRRRFPVPTSYPQLVLVVLAAAVAAATLVAAATSGAAFGAYNPGWDGTSELRGEADAAGAETVVVDNASRYESLPANDTVAFVLAPDERYGPDDADRVREFVEHGGTLVVADDVPARTNPLLADLGVTARIDGAPLRDERNYYRSPAMPRATNATGHPLVERVDAVTLNHGTALEPGNATVVVGSSEYAYLDRNRNEELDDAERLAERPVVTVESIGDGRVIATSDPSMLINVMIERADNRAFAAALVAGQERVVLDVSHAEDLPPLVAATLALRNSPALQLLAGGAGIAAVAAWQTGLLGAARRRVESRVSGWPAASPDELALTESDVAALLEREHPDWDETRRERVMTAIMNRDGEGTDNE